MAIGTMASIWKITREINLGEIKQEAEQRFRLLLVGEQAAALADALSYAPGQEGTHPWLVTSPLPLPQQGAELVGYDLALLTTPGAELSAPARSALQQLHDAGIPVVVVVVSEGAARQVGSEAPRQREAARVVLPTLAVAKVQEEVVPELLRVMGDGLALALARQLPLVRPMWTHKMIEDTSRANAIYAASTGVAEVIPLLTIPLAAADIFVLTKNQLVMAYKIALAAGKQGEPRDIMGQVVSVLGGGFLFRQIARELVGLIPVIGIVPKIAVAYAGTWVIGRTIFLWATQGEELSREQLSRFYQLAIERGQAVASALIDTMRERVPLLPDPAAPQGEEQPAHPSLWQRLRRRLPL